MARPALEDAKYEAIKAHILRPCDSPLPPDQQELLDRVMSIAKVLDKRPIERDAVALHMKKYPDVKRTQAYEDCRMAKRLYNSIHNFDYDFWQTWLIKDIVKSIDRCKGYKSEKAEKVIADLYGQLLKAIGEKPQKIIDPKLLDKHTFVLSVSFGGQDTNIDFMKLMRLPEGVRKQMADAIIEDIDFEETEKLIDS